ncbi:MAG: hypothetical protein IGR76_00115 [Synechococcales cyanobacterium T60_A2020_003]|nr:hypothetical protein [Synechococcales cyanobacterium T60_A2020_003]
MHPDSNPRPQVIELGVFLLEGQVRKFSGKGRSLDKIEARGVGDRTINVLQAYYARILSCCRSKSV